MQTTFCVYVHRDPATGRAFYVGKGSRQRAHSASGRNRHWKFYVSKHGFQCELIKAGMPEDCALAYERALIYSIGIDNLCNFAVGGRANSGWSHSKEAIKKIKEFQKSKPKCAASIDALNRHRPKVFTEGQRRKMSEAKKGKRRGPLPDWVKKKISASHMGLKPSPDAIEKMRKAKMGQRKREQNNKFDPTTRAFSHAVHGTFVGCSYDLRMKYGIGASCVRAIITGKQKTAKGWSYEGEVDGHVTDGRA